MFQSKKFKFIPLLSLVSLVTLTSCSSNSYNKDFPKDQDDLIVTVDGEGIYLGDIYYNTKEEYYKNLTDANKKTLDKLLLNYSETEIGNGTDLKGYTALTADEIREKEEKVMLDKVNTGSYDTNYIFDEEKFVMSLNKELNFIDVSENGTCDFSKETIVTKNSTFDEVFTCDYSAYMEKVIKPDIIRNQMVTEYLYLDSYTSIGTAAARGVKIVKLTDGTNDRVGTAPRFINAYLDDLANYDKNKPGYESYKYVEDINVLGEAYKGNTSYPGVSDFFAKHTDLQELTLSKEIDAELAKIATYQDGHYVPKPDNEIDKDLFSEYTGSMTYSIDVGAKMAKDALTQQQVLVQGMFLSSTGITDIPDEVKNRIFSSNYNTDPNNTSNKKDVTVYIGNVENNGAGKRLLTTPNSQNEGENREVIFYDSASTTYYLVEIDEVVTTSVIAKNSEDDDATKAKKKQLVKDVSYLMVDQSSYRSDAVVYFLKNLNIKYNNDSFFKYMKETYPALFEEETYEE